MLGQKYEVGDVVYGATSKGNVELDCEYIVLGVDLVIDPEVIPMHYYLYAIHNTAKNDSSIQYAYEGELKVKSPRAVCFSDILDEMEELYTRKNRDYGSSFAQTFQKLGLISAVTRLSDKTERLISLSTQPSLVKDESIEDTLIDLANYAAMTLVELRKNK